jgi:hypothetical protein
MADNQDIKEQEPVAEEKDFELEIEDDTPAEDRGRQPLPKEVVEELEQDELEDYSDKVKTRLKQMKKVWHDERREKERALREQQEALAMAQKALEENKALRNRLSEGEKSLVMTATSAAEIELEMAKRAYKEAYEAGDSDKLVDAQAKLNSVNFKLESLKGYRPPLQTQQTPDINEQRAQPQPPQLDRKTSEWRSKNTWFGQDEEMTATALGLHQKLEKQYGAGYVGTDEYWNTVDKTMRKRFSDYFGEDEEVETSDRGGKPAQRTEMKPANVVAPVSRSTSAKRIVLKQSQLAIAKRLGLTPEQYAKEMIRLEKQNG